MYATGQRIVNYEVVRTLGAGEHGVVYLCRHVTLDRLDAVKVLARGLVNNPDARERFEWEAAHAARLQHPGIVTVHDAGNLPDGSFYVAMDYIDGLSLDGLIPNGGISDIPRVLRLISAISGVLDAAHAAGLIHRDVKPSNILLANSGALVEHPFLVDFGIAKLLDDSRNLTTTQVIGTYQYMAPERIEGDSGSPASDQYSLACTAYHCLTGEVPFPGATISAIMRAHLVSEPPSISTRRPGLSAACDAVIARAMVKDPSARFATCREFAEALADVVATGPAAEAVAVIHVAPPDPPAAAESESPDVAVTARRPRPATGSARGSGQLATDPTGSRPTPAGPPPKNRRDARSGAIPKAATAAKSPPSAPGSGGPGSGKPVRRRWAVMLVIPVVAAVAAAVVALSGIGKPAVAGLEGPSPSQSAASPTASSAQQQAADVEAVIEDMKKRTILKTAIVDIAACRDLTVDVSLLTSLVADRRAELAEANPLRTDALPGGPALGNALVNALQASLTSAEDYLTWAERVMSSQCAPATRAATDPDRQAAAVASAAATQARQAFLNAWTPIAQQYGYQIPTEHQI